MDFPELLRKVRKDQPNFEPPEHMVCLDPGETTGYAYFHNGILTHTEQLPTHRIRKGVPLLQKIILPETDLIVYEDYKVYGWKTDSHAWDSLHTPKLIGAIETLAQLADVDTFTQMAQQPKGFCTDLKLKEWGYYQKGARHARDAIRHGCYYLLFNHLKK